MSKNVQNWIISIRSRFIWYLVIWHDSTYSPTHYPTHPPIHPPIGEGVSTNHKSSNRIELSWLGQDLLNVWVIWHDPTNQPSHPPTKRWRSLRRFQIFKQNWNILNSSRLIEFLLIPTVPNVLIPIWKTDTLMILLNSCSIDFS